MREAFPRAQSSLSKLTLKVHPPQKFSLQPDISESPGIQMTGCHSSGVHTPHTVLHVHQPEYGESDTVFWKYLIQRSLLSSFWFKIIDDSSWRHHQCLELNHLCITSLFGSDGSGFMNPDEFINTEGTETQRSSLTVSIHHGNYWGNLKTP